MSLDPSLVTAERDFLMLRVLHPDHTWVGMSSTAMIGVALQGGEPDWWPSDHADLGRCEETFRRAPAHLKVRMLPVLRRFREHVAALVDEREAGR